MNKNKISLIIKLTQLYNSITNLWGTIKTNLNRNSPLRTETLKDILNSQCDIQSRLLRHNFMR